MRLIDADKLILHLNDYALQTAPFKENENKEAYNAICECIKAVEEQTTAYDIDRIIEELEDYLFDKYCIENDSKIAEIVKQGCVSDDVCEWIVVDIPYLPVYGTGCGKTRLQYSTGIDVYCNGCGKKIKVVN